MLRPPIRSRPAPAGAAPTPRYRGPPAPARPIFLLVSAAFALFTRLASADDTVTADTVPELAPAPSLGELAGRRVTRLDVETVGGRWGRPVTLRRVRIGDPLSAELGRRALSELADSGRYAALHVEAVPDGGGVALRLLVTPRRIVAGTKISGGVLDEDDTLRAAGVAIDDEITSASLAESGEHVRAFYAKRGYPAASVVADAIDTDDAMRVIVVYRISAGEPRMVAHRTFRIRPAPTAELQRLVDSYDVDEGDRTDDDAITRADHDLQDSLRQNGWHTAEVTHQVQRDVLVVNVAAGPVIRIRFEGNHRYDDAELEDALELSENDDRSPSTLASRVEKYYVDRGFFDVQVTPAVRGMETEPENVLVLRVHEGDVMRVVAREYPCLTGARTANDVGEEIDSFLSEALPGTGFAGAVDPRVIDSTLGPRATTGARPAPEDANPWRTYVPEVYERATRHLQELYRSEGYLSATVGPVSLMRRSCDRHSPAGECIPVGARVRPPVVCPVGSAAPSPDPPPPPSCQPDVRRGVRCEPDVALHIPIKLGPRAVLWDAAFEGNRVLVEAELAKLAELSFGEPVSQVELEKARRRLLDEYAERGFAFASIEQRLEMSPDGTRARVRFVVSEREPVRVKDIIVRGARRTNESLILGRVAFGKGDVYKRSDVRATEERLATLGVFSSVTVDLEDPEVFAKEKVVFITVRERVSQHIEHTEGFTTGDGILAGLEYAHINIGGRAIRFTARIRLGYLPDFLIFDKQVRGYFDALPLFERLERRDTLSLEFPEVGLGPLFPFGIDVIDVRDNSRDFGLTKDAAIATLSYRPTTRFVTQLGGSLERNDAKIFAPGSTLADYLHEHPEARFRLLVPDGTTLAVAERTNLTWDRRDDPFDATRGTFFSASVEHVRATPTNETDTRPTSDFLRITSRIAGYVPLSQRGLAFALSFRWGRNVQLLPDSKTYPDRLFFLGGVDSLRGFLQDSVIPEDLAEQIIADQKRAKQPGVNPDTLLTPDKIPIRGGDLLLNPRAELRIPIAGVFQTVLFLDAGNLWRDPGNVDPWKLRYAAGTGLRVSTPVGPLALDIGYNLDKRAWEDPFAFHFSIGLF